MRPSEWAMQHIEFLSDYHRIVWVEDPYCLLEDQELSLLRHRVGLKGHAVVAVESAFRLRQELDKLDSRSARLILIDQSYTLRDPHLLPKDAKPADLKPIPASDWKPFVEKDAIFKPTVRDFLAFVTGDDHWPSEVNIYPYEKLARDNARGFVQAYETFRSAGRSLTTEDLIRVGASTVLKLNLFDINNPLDALDLGFHSQDRWDAVREFFNPKELEAIFRHLKELLPPLGDLFSDQAESARTALVALLVLRQHFEAPGPLLPILSSALITFQDCTVEPCSDAPAWFVEKEIPRFEKLLTKAFLNYLRSGLDLSDAEKAKQFARDERLSSKLRSLVPFDILTPPIPKPGVPDGFALDRLVPEFREAKRELTNLIASIRPSVERLRLTPPDKQNAKKILDVFVNQEFYKIEQLIGRLDSLMYYIDGPAKRQWQKIDGFEHRWVQETRECRDAIVATRRLRDELDIAFGKLLESNYARVVPGEILPADLFYQQFIGPRRRATDGQPLKAIIIVFDSMRFDIWRRLVRPMIERMYVIEEQIGFALLPSETRISRRSFFAGKPPSSTPKTGRESDFFAELVSSFHGIKIQLNEVPQAQKRPGVAFVAQSRDKHTTACVSDFADVMSHKVDWDPHTLNEMFRPMLLEVQALLAEAGPETRIFVTADHGHVLPHGRTPVWLEDATDVGYRSAYVTKRIEGQEAARGFQIPAASLRHAEAGWFVFPRPGFALRDAKSEPVRHGFSPDTSYRHGGTSLFEVVVPLACLRHREAPATIYLAASLRTAPVVGESCEILLSVSSDGIISSPLSITTDQSTVESIVASEISTTPRQYQMRFAPTAPGKQTIRVRAHLAEDLVGETKLEVAVAPAPAPVDKTLLKLNKLFGED